MAEFAQSAASRAAIHDAARSFVSGRATISEQRQHILTAPVKTLAKQAGVSERQVYRWRSMLLEKGSQKRRVGKKSLEKLAKADPGKVRLNLDATLVIGGDPAYSRRRSGIVVDLSADEASELLGHALGDEEDQDEAWQDFFDDYVCPAGWVEQPRIRFQ